MIISTPHCAAFVTSRTGFEFKSPHVAIGFSRGDIIYSAIVFQHWSGADIELTVAGDDLPRSLLREAGRYAFDVLKCARVTFRTPPDNTAAIIAMGRLGGRLEGTQRRFYGDRDALVFGILKEDYIYGRK